MVAPDRASLATRFSMPSGWAKIQLEEEVVNKSWFVSENDFENILSTDNRTLWKNKLMQKGGEYKIWANAPNNINLN